ncbi:ABC transporter substrate-binding protein [Leifsonia sp. F6_8S_P_1B]|uniref:ABC transporter substrate-binding protein n=1 Tax=Leifsonia williamsii TaxID=3035919 RepID=A0ABT8KAX2_9MICO|nr:ABC transporter substrate-binding protein [Leifsonia williamsii]MDN4614583.1 ABC transporter substrate-binding protein [Leifsonia williamsii]
MKSLHAARWAVPAGVLALALTMTGCAGASNGSSSSNKTLTVDTSFVVKTLDPGTVYEQTGNIAVHALYDTLVTFEGSNVTDIKPELASKWEQSSDGKTWTFTLDKDATFSDGSAVTAEDVVFSLNRLKNLKGSSSQTVQTLSFAAKGDDTVVVTSETPDPNVPIILAMPATSVINAEAAKKLGATDADDAAAKDKVGTQLDTESIGSGPYVIKSYDPSSKIVLTANPKYWGEKPAYGRVVIQNVDVQNQKLAISRAKGDEVALDLSGPQASELSSKLKVSGVADTSYFLSVNQDPAVSAVTSNPAFVKALRQTVDGPGIAKLFGKGATPASGLVPPAFAGALPEADAPKQDIDGATKTLADAGLTGAKAALVYPAITYRGVDLGTIVTKVQQDAKKAGIDIELTPQPINVFLQSQSEGKNEINFSPNSLNYPASDSLVNNMAPGASTSLRTGWTVERANPAAVQASKAVTAAVTPDARTDAMVAWQKVMNEFSPYIALANNAGIVVATGDLTGAEYTPAGWTVDLAAIAAK